MWNYVSELESDQDNTKIDVNAYSDMWVPCNKCFEYVQFGSIDCDSCKQKFTNQYWREFPEQNPGLLNFQAEENKEELDKEALALAGPDLPLSTDIDSLNITTMLCCNLPPDQCQCETAIPWSDVHSHIDSEIDQLSYASYFHPGSEECADCAYYFSPKCIPYRNLTRKYLLANVLVEPIEVCKNYTAANDTNSKEAFNYE